MEQFIVINYILDEEEKDQRKRLRLTQKRLRDRTDPFDVPEKFFMHQYRLSKASAKYVVDVLTEQLVDENSAPAIPMHLKVLCALQFYGHGCFQRPTGMHYHWPLSQSSVSRCIKQVTDLICTHLTPTLVQFPVTDEQRSHAKQGFYLDYGMPGILAAMDGVHIAIQSPPCDNLENPGHLYRNRKGYHSLNVMILCDSKMKILFVDATFPGSVHDSAVWQVSDVKAVTRQQYTGSSWILADSGYPIEPWLLTPIHNPITLQERAYNKKHIKARNVVERCFGILKGRFRCLHRYRTLHYNPLRASQIVYAVIALHNLCIRRSDPLIDDETTDFDDDNSDSESESISQPPHSILQAGRAARTTYIRNFI